MSNVQLKFSFCDIFFGWNKLTNFWAPIRTWPLIMKMLLLKCMPNRDLKHKSKWISFSNLVQPHYSYLKQYPCLNETKLYFYCLYRTALFFIWFKKFHCKSMFQTLYMIRWGLVFEKFLFCCPCGIDDNMNIERQLDNAFGLLPKNGYEDFLMLQIYH